MGEERAKTNTTGPHPKAAAEGGDIEAGTTRLGLGSLAARAVDYPRILSAHGAQPNHRTLLLSQPLQPVLGWGSAHAGVRPGVITKPFA